VTPREALAELVSIAADHVTYTADAEMCSGSLEASTATSELHARVATLRATIDAALGAEVRK
jgi:hypothetical protein